MTEIDAFLAALGIIHRDDKLHAEANGIVDDYQRAKETEVTLGDYQHFLDRLANGTTDYTMDERSCDVEPFRLDIAQEARALLDEIILLSNECRDDSDDSFTEEQVLDLDDEIDMDWEQEERASFITQQIDEFKDIDDLINMTHVDHVLSVEMEAFLASLE